MSKFAIRTLGPMSLTVEVLPMQLEVVAEVDGTRTVQKLSRGTDRILVKDQNGREIARIEKVQQ